MSNLMNVLEYVKVYLVDTLVLTKDSFEDYLEKIKEVLAKLLQADLSVHSEKTLVCI